MFTLVSVLVYAIILWTLGVLVIRERRRERLLRRVRGGFSSPYFDPSVKAGRQ